MARGQQRHLAGQAMVEYAVVTAGVLAIILALGAFLGMLEDALPVEHAVQSASHHVQSAAPGALADVLQY